MLRSERIRAAAVVAACAVLWSQAVSAADGKALFARCAACHGARGEGVASTGAPAIAGLDAAYLERQLAAFAAGTRGAKAGDAFGATMRATIATMLPAEADRKAVATYVASLPAPSLGPPVAASDNGRNYFNSICGACHGSKGQGNTALGAPRIGGQSATYLARQLGDFASGARGAGAGDRYGAQMRSILAMLPDATTTRDVVAYAAGLRP